MNRVRVNECRLPDFCYLCNVRRSRGPAVAARLSRVRRRSAGDVQSYEQHKSVHQRLNWEATLSRTGDDRSKALHANPWRITTSLRAPHNSSSPRHTTQMKSRAYPLIIFISTSRTCPRSTRDRRDTCSSCGRLPPPSPCRGRGPCRWRWRRCQSAGGTCR